MPNGLSGFFRISKSALVELLSSCPRDVEIGSTMTVSFDQDRRFTGTSHPLDVSRMLVMVENYPRGDIVVEEHERRSYAVLLDGSGHGGERDFTEWVRVPSSSPLFAALRARHDSHGERW
jgi:hypothetical protein